MGHDPKPSKRRKPQTPSLPMLPKTRTTQTQHQEQPAPVLVGQHQTRIPSGPDYEQEVTTPAVHQLMEQITGAHADGYYKITTGDEGKTWFVAYKWQHGAHAGCYVMARVHRGELGLAFVLLAEKVLAVRAGVRRPTRDRYEG